MENLTQREKDILGRLADLGLELSPAEVADMVTIRQRWQEQNTPEGRERVRLLTEFCHLEAVN